MMGSIGTAFRAFYRALVSRETADQVAALLDGRMLPKVTVDEKSRQPAAEPKPQAAALPKRSEAVTLLAALQREARLVDLIKEDLAAYTDEQVGAAARSVLRDAAAILDRFFGLKRVLGQAEGELVEVPAGYDPGRYHVLDNAAGNPPYRGTLAHAGWQATIVTLPTWSGSKEASLIIAPAEVELS